MVVNNNYSSLLNNDENRLTIYTLGRFMVHSGTLKLSSDFGRSKKVWELFMYLLTFREKMLPPEAIAEALWPEQEYSSPRSSVKNLVHRLRHALDAGKNPANESPIIYNYGCYGWNADYPYWLDTEYFERGCHEARNLIDIDPVAACEIYLRVLEVYRGEYLSEKQYSDWVYPARYHYRSLYISSTSKLLAMLKQQGFYQKIIQMCEIYFSIEPFEEDLHLRYLEALLESGEIERAREHYEYISRLLYQEFGTKPSSNMRDIYKAISNKSTGENHHRLDIEEMLLEHEDIQGPIACKTDFFSLVCRLEKRRAERNNSPVCLGSMVFKTPESKFLSTTQLQEAMKLLDQLLASSLRKGDIYTQWNDNQYAILLPGANREQAEEILGRISARFKNEKSRTKLDLQTKVHPVVPVEFL